MMGSIVVFSAPISPPYSPKSHAAALRPRSHWSLLVGRIDRKVASRTVTIPHNPLAAASSWHSRLAPAAVAPTSPPIEDAPAALQSAADIVRIFYEGINGRDLAAVEELIGEKCVYEDLIFPRPFVGRKAILEFFDKFIGSISGDLKFAIDDISAEDSSAVGVTWHLEWKEKPFPFSKGCSFYRLEVIDSKRQIM